MSKRNMPLKYKGNIVGSAVFNVSTGEIRAVFFDMDLKQFLSEKPIHIKIMKESINIDVAKRKRSD